MRTRWRKVLIPLFFVASGGLHAAFIVPTTGPVPFHRAGLPLDKDRLHEVFVALTTLGKVKADAEPAVLRRAAQALALAIALEPDQKGAEAVLEKLVTSQSPDLPDAENLEKGHLYLESIRAWLVESKAPDALALADCISDVLAEPGSTTPEHGVWKDWVADLADFTPAKKEEVVKIVVPEQHVTPPPIEPQKPQEEVVEPKLVPILVDTVQSWNRAELDVKFIKGSFYLVKGSPLPDMIPIQATAAMQAMKSAEMKVSSSVQFYQKIPRTAGNGSLLNHQDLSGSAVVMMNACVTGVPPAATALATVWQDGSIGLPSHFWDLLKQPDEVPKGRLIVSEKAANYLVSTLAINDAAFFLQHEVVIASDVKTLCDAASSEPSESLKQAYAQFAEIRQAGEKMPLGPFLSHPTTIQRLHKIADACPQHASARILLLQATNSRPRYVKTEVVTDVVKQVASYLVVKVPSNTEDTTSQEINEIHEKCRKVLDPYSPFIDPADQDLYKQGVDLVNELRAYSRLVGASTRDVYGYGNSSVKAQQSEQQIRTEAKKLVAKLSGALITVTPEAE